MLLRRGAVLGLCLAATGCTMPPSVPLEIHVSEQSPKQLYVRSYAMFTGTLGMTDLTFKRVAKETLDRSYTHFRVEEARSTVNMRTGEMTIVLIIDLLRDPESPAPNIYDAKVIFDDPAKMEIKWRRIERQ